MTEVIEQQNDTIIALLARQVFGDKIFKIVTQKKKTPKQWIRGYNSCDGKHGVSEIAKIAGVKQPTATVILKSWEEDGIVYNIGSKTKPQYRRLIKLKE